MKRNHALLILLTALLLMSACLVASEGGEPEERGKEPNLLIDVSAAAVNAVVQRRVDRTEPVQEVIQETPVSGMGRTLGAVWAELVPDARHAVVDVVLGSRIYSRTVAIRPHVLVHTATVMPLEVRRRIVIDGQGIRAFAGPKCAEASTCLLDVTSRAEPDYLAIRFACRGFEGSRAAAEAETACKAARKAADRLAEDLTPALTSASASIGRELSKLKRAGVSLNALDFHTTPDFVQARLRIGALGRVPQSPSPPLPDDTDLGLRVHESSINEVAQASLAGKAFALNEVSKFYDETTLGLLRDARKKGLKTDGLKSLEKLLAELAGTPTTITLTQKDPLTVVFTKQGFVIEIHVESIRQAPSVFAGMRVRGTYQLENTEAGVLLVRKGPVQFLPFAQPSLAQKKLDPQPASFLLLREILFTEVMKERLLLVVPMPEASVRLAAPRAQAGNGWLSLTWKLANQSPE